MTRKETIKIIKKKIKKDKLAVLLYEYVKLWHRTFLLKKRENECVLWELGIDYD